MGSSGAAMNRPLYRRGTPARWKRAPVVPAALRPAVLGLRSSVNGLASLLDLCRQVGAQTIVVVLQIFDHGLEVTHPNPKSGALPEQTVVHVDPLT